MAAIRAKRAGKGTKLVKCHTAECPVFETPPPTESEATEANTSGSDVTTSASSIFTSAATAQAGNDSDLSSVPSDNELDESLVRKSVANMTQLAASSTAPPSGSTNPKRAAAPIKKPRCHTTKKANGF